MTLGGYMKNLIFTSALFLLSFSASATNVTCTDSATGMAPLKIDLRGAYGFDDGSWHMAVYEIYPQDEIKVMTRGEISPKGKK